MGLFNKLMAGPNRKKLFEAVKDHEPDVVEELLEKEVPPDVKDKDGMTPLHILMGGNARNPTELITANVPERAGIARMLVEAGCDVNEPDNDGETALHKASEAGQTSAVETLLELGADVHTRDNWGRTPLHPAVFLERLEIVEILLKAGADPNATDNSGQGAYQPARNSEHMIEILKAHGVKS